MTVAATTASGTAFRRVLTLALPCLAVACGVQEGRLTGDSLTIAPCRDGRPRIFAPVDIGFDHLTWVRNTDANATLEIRSGWRISTTSDEIVVQFIDLPAVREAWRTAPGAPMALDGVARVALSMRDTCPEPQQSLVAETGTLTLAHFDLEQGGRIAGTAHFDLRDAREDPSSPPAGTNLTLTFTMDLQDKDPLTGYGR